MRNLLFSAVFAAVFGVASSASATTIFSDDFETNLGQWNVGSNAILVADPTNAANMVLSFNDTDSGGDLFASNLINLDAGFTYSIEFDYYGDKGNDSSSGGFAGVANGLPGDHAWYAGTVLGSLTNLTPSAILLEDGAVWRHIVYTFIAPFGTPSTDLTSIRLIFEDFSFAGSTAGNAYFDNVVFSVIPVPAALPLFGTGLAILGLMGWRRKRKAV